MKTPALNKDLTTKNKLYFGTDKETGEKVYLSIPTWDCGWYWGFGYLGNKDCHYNLYNYNEKTKLIKDESGKYHFFTQKRNICMFDALKEDYDLCKPLKIDKNLWEFCELVKTIYTLKESAEVFNRGGSHYASNPCKSIIERLSIYEEINSIMIPSLINQMIKIFLK